MIQLRNILTVIILMSGSAFCSLAQEHSTNRAANLLEIHSVTVDGKAMLLRHGTEVNLGTFPNNILFDFGMNTNIRHPPLKIRTKLEGYDNEWKVSNGEMFLDLRFFNSSGDQVSHTMFLVRGGSAGWNGSLKTSPRTHRRETQRRSARGAPGLGLIPSAGPAAPLWLC